MRSASQSIVADQHIAVAQHRVQLRRVGHVVRVARVGDEVDDQARRCIEQP
jgi:hypothetical protein